MKISTGRKTPQTPFRLEQAKKPKLTKRKTPQTPYRLELAVKGASTAGRFTATRGTAKESSKAGHIRSVAKKVCSS